MIRSTIAHASALLLPIAAMLLCLTIPRLLSALASTLRARRGRVPKKR